MMMLDEYVHVCVILTVFLLERQRRRVVVGQRVRTNIAVHGTRRALSVSNDLI